MNGVKTFDRVVLSIAACVATELLSTGYYSAAAACLMFPLFAHGCLLVVDVFWTSFTGLPLIRSRDAHPSPAARLDRESAVGGLPSLPALPEPMQLAPRDQSGRVFTALGQLSAVARPAGLTSRLRRRKEQLGIPG